MRRKDHHVVTVEKIKEKVDSGDWNRHLTDALEDLKVPGGKQRGMAQHTNNLAHKVYSQRSGDIVDQVLALAKQDGINIADMSAKQSKEMAQMMVDQINSDPFNKTFNKMVASGADTRGMKKMLSDFGGKEKMLKTPAALNPKLFNRGSGMFKKMGGNLTRKLGPLSVAAFFTVDLQAQGLGVATENAVKSATFYDVTVEPVGDAYSGAFDSVRNNARYGTFSAEGDGAAGNIGRAMNARQRALEALY